MKDSDIPTRFVIPWANSAGAPYIRPIPVASQIGVTPGAASLTDGFPPVTMQPEGSGGVPPFGQDWNGILQQITQWNQWQQAGAPIGYDPTFSSSIGGYPKDAVLLAAIGSGNYWSSTVDDNTSDPDAGGAGWIVFGGISMLGISGAATTYTQAQNNLQLVRTNSASPMQDTLPGTSPGVLAAGTIIRITNGEATALLSVSVGIGAALFSPRSKTVLGPGQSLVILSDGTNYHVVSIPDRVIIKANATYLFVSLSGNDSNDGLTAATPLALMTTAFNLALREWDLASYEVTCQVAAGSYNEATDCHGTLVGLGGGFRFLGNVSNPALVNNSINNANAFCFGAGGGAQITVEGFTLQNSSGPILFTDGQGAFLRQGSNIFGVGSVQMSAADGARMILIGSYSITQSANAHFVANAGGVIEQGAASIVITTVGTPNFANAFAIGGQLGLIFLNQASLNFAGSGATGKRFDATTNAVVSTSGGGPNFFPGSVAGTTSTGGQYA